MLLKKVFPVVFILAFLSACNEQSSKTEYADVDVSSEQVPEPGQNDIDSQAFEKLINLTDSIAKTEQLSDSLSFLIIPLDAVCPHCRDKALKALMKHRDKITKEHYVIISASSYKGINSFFAEKNMGTPEVKDKVFLDGDSEAFKSNLIFMHPTVYYTHNKKIIKKIVSYPTNIDKVLEEFFGG